MYLIFAWLNLLTLGSFSSSFLYFLFLFFIFKILRYLSWFVFIVKDCKEHFVFYFKCTNKNSPTKRKHVNCWNICRPFTNYPKGKMQEECILSRWLKSVENYWLTFLILSHIFKWMLKYVCSMIHLTVFLQETIFNCIVTVIYNIDALNNMIVLCKYTYLAQELRNNTRKQFTFYCITMSSIYYNCEQDKSQTWGNLWNFCKWQISD